LAPRNASVALDSSGARQIDPLNAPDAAGADPYLILILACLPALDLESDAVARLVLTAIRETGASYANRMRLTAIILKRASDAARQNLEDLMSTDEWKDDFIESYVKIGVEQGAADAKAEDILEAMDARGLRPTPEQRARVTAAAGIAQLDRWFKLALTADTAADVFKDPGSSD
jgi:hypothetical protein